ncbi:hypothetical protein [Acinetobacter sp. YH12239]|uniref:hypothetical protein n=1 Tax=Acinetobacter sp. YH12239 TaxID=2601166 RepID=UPI0015D2BBD3|nr:hypothetical protein [Acinetobacter sp. YH12239]
MHNYIPYDLRSKLFQIDPNLDVHWQTRLKNIFNSVPAPIQGLIQEQFLTAKNIYWDQHQQSFTFKGIVGLQDLSSHLISPKMRTLAEKIAATLETLKSYQDVIKIADYLETVQNQIDRIETEEDQSFLRDKQLLRKTFLYDAANIIKTLDLNVPDNCRHLTAEEIRTFILEVHIKHQILGYWFKTILPRQLKQISHPLFQDFIIQEQKIRDFDVIESSQYLYLVATIHDFRQNPYSIRRFLMEEKLGLEDRVYLNGVVLDKKRLNDPSYLEQFKWQVSRIITIQRQITTPILDLMEKFHNVNFDLLLPLLKKPLDASGFSVEQVINERLLDFEKALTLEILQPFQYALRHSIRHPDEFDYCFISMHRLFSDIASFYKDFSSEPIIAFNTQAQIFEYKILSYLKLMEKRRHTIFVSLDAESYAASHSKSQAAIEQVKTIIADALDQHKVNQIAFNQKKRELESQSNKGFFQKMFDKTEKLKSELEALKLAGINNRRIAYLDLVKVPKKHDETTVYLEFESLISINQTERHYAFVNGDNGVSALPILIQLPEDKEKFNLQQVSNTLNFDLTKARQKWV